MPKNHRCMRVCLVSFVLFAALPNPMFAERLRPIVVVVNPKPSTIAAGSLVAGPDGSLYLAGEVDGQDGLMKINSETGELSFFSTVSAGNSVVMGPTGEFLYTLSGGLNKVDLRDGSYTTVPLSSVPTMAASSLMAGKDGFFYVSGGSGLIRISPTGQVSNFSDVSAGNSVTTDLERENIWVRKPSKMVKVSMVTGQIVEEVPFTSDLVVSLGSFDLGADNRFYFDSMGRLASIDLQDGVARLEDESESGDFAVGFDGRTLYQVLTSPFVATSGGVQPAAASSAGLHIRKYALTAPSVPESKVAIQGGARGYVNPARGESVRIHLTPAYAADVHVKIYTLAGGLVHEFKRAVAAGQAFLDWDGKDGAGEPLASDVYVMKIEGAGIDETKKVAIVR